MNHYSSNTASTSFKIVSGGLGMEIKGPEAVVQRPTISDFDHLAIWPNLHYCKVFWVFTTGWTRLHKD